MNTNGLSVFGLGKLGATMVGCFASKGFDVIGVDVNESAVESVRSGTAPVPEPGLQELYDDHHERIRATGKVAEAVRGSDVSFIIVPTPSMPNGEFFTTIAARVAEDIGRALKDKDSYHVVVLTSTVLPGATERDIKSALQTHSGKTCGPDFGLCYSPEFIAIGEVIKGLLHPDFFLIGEFDKKSGDVLEEIYRAGADPDTQVARMNIPNAELTKIAVNTYVTTKISFANTLSRVCSRMPGGDARVVADAIGRDKRIGSRYLTPGPLFGGPCFPRDNRAFAWFARDVGADAPIAEATDAVNRQQVDFLCHEVERVTTDGQTIGILGLSYKPNTDVVEESQAVEMAKRFIGRGYAVVAYDPWVSERGLPDPIEGLDLLASLDDCLARSDVFVIATAWPEFEELTRDQLARGEAMRPVIDIWGVLSGSAIADNPAYCIPGVHRGT